MRWATRAGVQVDRAASAWLICRFIDVEAAFVFVDDPDDVPADATPFDMIGVDFTHHGDDVTFETLLARHGLDDPALVALGRIVHQADVSDDLYDAPEGAGLDALFRGLSLTETDPEILALALRIFDGLYAFLHRRLPS